MIPRFRAYFKKDNIMTNVDTILFLQGGIKVSDGCWHDEFLSDEVILMQSTGLKDVNGVEIYEGDIVEYYHLDKIIAVVKMVDGCWVLDEKGLDTEFEYLYPESDAGKVIGNVHENEDLIISEVQN